MKKSKNSQVIFTPGRTIALISAIVLVISALLPWGAVSDYSVKGINLTENGINGDGLLTISIGIFAFILVFIRKIATWIPVFLGVAALIIGVNDFGVMKDTVVTFNGEVGLGLYTTILASLGLVIGTAMELFMDKEAQKRLFFFNK